MPAIVYQIMLFLHVVGATLLGFYLVLPFLAGRSGHGAVGALLTLNRIGQFALIAAFITGGAIMTGQGLAVSWMITTMVLFLALGAVSGIMGVNMKRVAAGGNSAAASKVKSLSWIAAIVFVGILYVMVNRWYA